MVDRLGASDTRLISHRFMEVVVEAAAVVVMSSNRTAGSGVVIAGDGDGDGGAVAYLCTTITRVPCCECTHTTQQAWSTPTSTNEYVDSWPRSVRATCSSEARRWLLLRGAGTNSNRSAWRMGWMMAGSGDAPGIQKKMHRMMLRQNWKPQPSARRTLMKGRKSAKIKRQMSHKSMSREKARRRTTHTRPSPTISPGCTATTATTKPTTTPPHMSPSLARR